MKVFFKTQVASMIATLVDFAVTLILTELAGFWYLAATSTGTMLGGITHFCLLRYRVFGKPASHLSGQLLRYLLVWSGGILLNISGVFILTDLFGFNYIISKIIVSITLGITFNYLLQKYFVFNGAHFQKTGKGLLLLFVPLLLQAMTAHGQAPSPTIVSGKIRDIVTKEPIPLVSVIFVKTNYGTTSEFDGTYSIRGKRTSGKIRFSCIGYKPAEFAVVNGKTQTLDVEMQPEATQLSEVVVKPKKIRYRNKDNPAVELINKVISNKNLNHAEAFAQYQAERYEKTQFAVSNLTEKFKNRRILKKFRFIFQNVDTVRIPGKEILPIYLKESVSDIYSTQNPSRSKEVTKAEQMVTFEGYMDKQGVSAYLRYLYQDIDLYKTNITFLTNSFLSPIAATAPGFYRYFIMDTLMIDSTRCYKLLFAPRNKTDMLFQGFLYITFDSTYAIRRAELSVPNDINLNWAKDVRIYQDFSRIDHQGWALTYDMLGIDFGIFKNRAGIYGERIVSNRKILINSPLTGRILDTLQMPPPGQMENRNKEFWKQTRHLPLSASESGTYDMMDSLQRVPLFKNIMNISMLLLAGYRDLGPFEIGPVNTFYSWNSVEGYRIRAGGRTTDKFNKRFNLETYVAYGFTDTKVKYFLSGTYSLTGRSIFQFPVKSVKISIQDETKIPGQELQFVQEDNFLLSFKRGINDKILYNKTFLVEHLNEFPNHFSYKIGYQFLRQRPGGNLYFNPRDYNEKVNDPAWIDISEFSLTLRFAPHEAFYQGKSYRVPLAPKYPVTRLQLTWGDKMFGNDYNYLNVRVSVTKRFYLPLVGYNDFIFEAGKIFGKVPFPLLFIHRANQTYSYQLASYNLMNFLEFVSDEFASVNFDHCFNGFFFNKVPLLKRLKWRENIAFKALYGGVTRLNDPAVQPDLFRFPTDERGVLLTYPLARGPYIEVSAGISNVLKFFRVEVVKRMTYLNNPNVSDIGLRVRFKMDF